MVKAQNEKYQQRLKDLETRINTIQALQNSRVGPVELMSSLGNVVSKTTDVYLYTMAPVGDKLAAQGPVRHRRFHGEFPGLPEELRILRRDPVGAVLSG